MKKAIIITATLFLFAAFLQADAYIKQVQHTDAVSMMGQTQPASDLTQEIWIGNDKMASHMKGQSSIIDMKQNIMYMINHEARSYIPMKMPVNIMEYMPDQMAGMMEGMMGSITVSVTPKGTGKKVKNWNCKGYDVVMEMSMMGMPMKMNMVVWATKDVPFDWKKVTDLMSNMMKAQMRISDKAIAQLKKIDGYWIAMEMSMDMMGSQIKSRTEVIEIDPKRAPTGTAYTIPADYTKKDKMDMADMQRR